MHMYMCMYMWARRHTSRSIAAPDETQPHDSLRVGPFNQIKK
jgi:hypothetical protein